MPETNRRGVFVDEAGRRSRWIAAAGRLVGAACIVYIVVTVSSLFGATWVPKLSLPVVGRVAPSVRPATRLSLPATAAHTPFPTRSSTPPPPAPSSTPTPTPTPTPTTTAPGRSGSAPGKAPTTTVAASPTTTAAPPPGHSGTAPGKIKKSGG